MTDRYQQCQINGFLSKKGKIISRVPQGSILSPLLFLIYIDDLPNCLKSTIPCLYADDTQTHPNKTKMMVIGSRYNLNLKVSDLCSNIRMNNNVVLSVFSQKCLGIYLDERLDFDSHIENLCKKICSGIGVLRRIKSLVPKECLLKLCKSLIQPYFDYCSPLWDTCDKTLKDNLQTLQNRAARIIYGAHYDTRSKDLIS